MDASIEANRPRSRSILLGGFVLTAIMGLSACSSIGYRCPLDPNEQPSTPTACAGMHDAISGAKKGTGGRTSVFVDDQGRIVPPELIESSTANPIAGSVTGHQARHTPPSGSPVYQNPKVYQVWSSSFQDSNGNLHDGHHAWFATPGKWNTGTVDSSSSVGSNIMKPTSPKDMPFGQVVPTDRHGNPIRGAGEISYQPVTQQSQQSSQSTDQVLESLGQAASAAQRQGAPQSASGVTAPAVRLGN